MGAPTGHPMGPYRTAEETLGSQSRPVQRRLQAMRHLRVVLKRRAVAALTTVILLGAVFGQWNVQARQAFALLTPTLVRIEDIAVLVVLITVPLMFASLVDALRVTFIPGRMKRRWIARTMFVQLVAVALGLVGLVAVRPSWPLAREILRAPDGPDGRTAFLYRAPGGDECAVIVAVEDGTFIRIVAVVSPTSCDAEAGRLQWRDQEIALIGPDGREVTSGTLRQWHR
jgi:hypothetical protein